MREIFPAGHDDDADLFIWELAKPPLLPRLLRLRHLRLTTWQRILFGDVPLAAGVLLVLADIATAWTLLALPLAVLAMVKLHDLLAGRLARPSG